MSDRLVFLIVVLWVIASSLVSMRVVEWRHECDDRPIQVTKVTVTHPSQVALIEVPERVEIGNRDRRGNA